MARHPVRHLARAGRPADLLRSGSEEELAKLYLEVAAILRAKSRIDLGDTRAPKSHSILERPTGMTTLKSLATICAVALLTLAASAFRYARGEPVPGEFCAVEQLDPYTMWRMDTLAPVSCKTVIEKSRSPGK